MYIIGHSGNQRVSGSLVRAMCVSFHVLVALLCSTYGAFHVACLFLGPFPNPPGFSFFKILFIIYPVGFPLFFQFNMTGARARVRDRVFAGMAHGWVAGSS